MAGIRSFVARIPGLAPCVLTALLAWPIGVVAEEEECPEVPDNTAPPGKTVKPPPRRKVEATESLVREVWAARLQREEGHVLLMDCRGLSVGVWTGDGWRELTLADGAIIEGQDLVILRLSGDEDHAWILPVGFAYECGGSKDAFLQLPHDIPD